MPVVSWISIHPWVCKQFLSFTVGGGSAGCVLANRLSEMSDVNVLLLEAGGEAPVLSEIPAIPRTMYQSKVDWTYKTVPQKHCAKSHKGRVSKFKNWTGVILCNF